MKYNEEYTQWIKMNEKAWPIIKDDMPMGALLFSRRLRMLYVVDGEVGRWQDIVNTSNCDRAIPLLEQDQLQEMVKGTCSDLEYAHVILLGKVYRLVAKMELAPTDSMEQLWLAFVMKEKYNKIWGGEDWISG